MSNQHRNSLIIFDKEILILNSSPVKVKVDRPKGQIPYGWKVNPFGQLSRHEIEQRIIGRIVALHEEGKSLRNIADYLNSYDIPTKNGGFWQANTIRNIILSNR